MTLKHQYTSEFPSSITAGLQSIFIQNCLRVTVKEKEKKLLLEGFYPWDLHFRKYFLRVNQLHQEGSCLWKVKSKNTVWDLLRY